MPRDTLLDFFEDFAAFDDTFVVHDDGYRVREVTYRQLAGAVVVPVDYRASAELLQRVAAIVAAKAILVGTEVRLPAGGSVPIWELKTLLAEVGRADVPGARRGATGRPTARDGRALAEIIFTSGATADPK